MNNKFISIALSFLIISAPVFSYEKEDRSSIIEAGDAILGRVFGVQGAGGDVSYHVFELTSHTPNHAAVRSALVPGWGQHFNQQHVKGALLLLTTAAAATGSVLRYRQSRDSFHDYERAGVKNGSDFEDYEDKQTQAYVLGGIAIILYGVGIFDAYKSAYNPLYSKNSSLQIAAGPDESRLVWVSKF